MQWNWPIAWLALPLCAAACGSSRAPSDQQGSRGEDDLAAAACAVKAGVASSPMRRLTRDEFAFAVTDLLGVDGREATAGLPPDEISAGFANNASVTLQLAQVQDFQEAARLVAEAAASDVEGLTGCQEEAAEAQACDEAWLERLAERAIHSGSSQEQREELVTLYRSKSQATDRKEGIRLAVETLLQYPSFLYRFVQGEQTRVEGVRKLTARELASRLSFFLWASVPDEELLAAAAEGALEDASGVETQARRMMEDERFKRAQALFALDWLGISQQAPLKSHPLYNEEVWASSRQAVARFFASQVEAGASLTHLLTAPVAFVDQHVAPLYGLSTQDQSLEAVQLDPRVRGGLLLQAGVMQALGSSEVSRPIKRGLFVRNRLLCQDPPPPPPDGIPPAPAPSTPQTIRERLEAHRRDPACASCHSFFDPIGMAFEHYDEVGQRRMEEEGRAIDASGELTETDVDGPFDDAMGLMALLGQSEMATRCLGTQLMRFALARLDEEVDTCVLDAIVASDSGELPVMEMFLRLTTTDAFRFTGSP